MIRSIFTLTFCVLVLSAIAAAQNIPADRPAKLISTSDFILSAEDEATGIDGTMKIAVEVDSSGKVTKAGVYVGPKWPCTPGLEKLVDAVIIGAEKTVMKYKFSPAIENGKPVTSRVSLKMTIGRSARQPVKPRADSPDGPGSAQFEESLTGGVLNGKAVSLPKPGYPDAARGTGITGKVIVEITIDELGNVMSAQAIEGPTVLQFAARAAACGAKFTPTLLKGKPVKVSGKITYNFEH